MNAGGLQMLLAILHVIHPNARSSRVCRAKSKDITRNRAEQDQKHSISLLYTAIS